MLLPTSTLPCGVSCQVRSTEEDAEEEETTMGDGTLRPAPAHGKGDVSLIINIDKWGFKDAMSYYEPRVVVSVRDENGKAVEAVQVGAVRAEVSGSTAWSQ